MSIVNNGFEFGPSAALPDYDIRADDPRLGVIIEQKEHLQESLLRACFLEMDEDKRDFEEYKIKIETGLDPATDRAKEKFKKEVVECGDIVIIGFPFDEGCARNGGRAGSRLGPEMFEKALKTVGPVCNAELGIDLRGNEKKKNVSHHDRQPGVTITYIGCVSGARHMKRRLRREQAAGETTEEGGPSLEDAHVDLEELVLAVLSQDRFPFVIGGSNDQSASNGRAFLRHHYERELRELRNEHGYKEHHFHRHKHGIHAMAAAAAAAAETLDGRLIEVGGVASETKGQTRSSARNSNGSRRGSQTRSRSNSLAAASAARASNVGAAVHAALDLPPAKVVPPSLPAVSIINIDAHLDVRRPYSDGRVHSGTPFRELLSHPLFYGNHRFVEFAAQSDCCSAEHVKFVEKSKKGQVMWLSEVQKKGAVAAFQEVLEKRLLQTMTPFIDINGNGSGFSLFGKKRRTPELFFSFDMDAIRASDCPGVSAPGACGLTAEEALALCFEAGKNPHVGLFDISEMNPAIEDFRTPRLAAQMFYRFVLGFALRKKALAHHKK